MTEVTISKEVAQLTLQFLQRAMVQGTEVGQFQQVVQNLQQAIAMSNVQAVPEPVKKES
jgi:hypothetical protein